MRPKIQTVFGKAVVALALVATQMGSPVPAQAESKKLLKESQPVSSRFRRDLPRNHDRGAFLRMSLGVGYALVATDDGDDRFEESGLGAMPNLSVGWLPWEQLAIHASSWGMLGGDVGVLGIGPGATHYFDGRDNLWLSGQIGVVTIKDRENWGDQWAIGTEIEAGLYGWTGRKWSMGASVFGGLEGIDVDSDDRAPWGWRLGLRLGVVYN